MQHDDPEVSTQPGAIDWSVLDSMKMFQQPGKPDLRKQLMSLYLSSSPELMQGIRNSVATLDGQALMHAAHALKSSSMSLGATTLSEQCSSLEQLGRAKTLDNAPALLDRAETEFAAVCSAFRQALDVDVP
ncbi:Hpt protein [Pelobacter propionicus DSM 2379]|uniref:Hpt protein n=2 Tax=Pelobacter propionicus TaxID=29543 RepID=A1ANY7_PELPD|nr:Hpt protein [Pelobacter propionicus DSM 2379]